MLQKEGAHISKYKAKDTEDGKATKEGPSLGRTEPRKDAKGKASPRLQADPVPMHLQIPCGFIKWGPRAGAFRSGAELLG